MEGINEILKAYSANYVLAIVAKGDQKRMDLLTDLGIKHYFQFISFKAAKAEEDYWECIKKFQFKPNHCWSIGDRIKSEITISKSLGIKTIWFKNGKFSQEIPKGKHEQPDYTITSFGEIRNIIPG